MDLVTLSGGFTSRSSCWSEVVVEIGVGAVAGVGVIVEVEVGVGIDFSAF